MGKVTQVTNGDTGSTARAAWNQAAKSGDIEPSDLKAGTDGELITWDSSGNPTTVSAGTDDYVLTANGVGAEPNFQDPAANALIQAYVTAQLQANPSVKSYTYKSRTGVSGIEFIGGYYEAPAADANLDQATPTQTYGTANISYAAHAFTVSAGAGTTDGSDLVLTVSGTSITDAGVRTAGDSEVVIADCTAAATDQYHETSKKWIGQITYTLTSTGGTAFSHDFNYGISKYDDMNNTDFQLQGWEFVGLANANDSGFNMEVLLHDGTGWTYSAAAFAAGGTSLGDMNTDHNTEIDMQSGEYFAWKRTGLTQDINADTSEGIVIKITTATNNSVDFMDCHVQFIFMAGQIT